MQVRVGLGRLGGGLDAREARPGDGERPGRVVAQGDREFRVLDRERVRDGGRARSERVDQRVVGEFAAVVQDHAPRRGVDRGGPALDEPDARGPDQVGDAELGELVARGRLVLAQALVEALDRVEEGDAGGLGAAGDADGRHHAGVPGADDEDVVHAPRTGAGPRT
nr:hypothetical protein GCM10025732_35420 [Glycomyces mayteni]